MPIQWMIKRYRPGRPFWTSFTAFASSMISLWGMDSAHLTWADVQVNFVGGFLVSSLVAMMVYGREKLHEIDAREKAMKKREDQDGDPDA